MLGIVSQIDQIFDDQKSYHLMTTIVILFHSQKQGCDIDISAFAAALDVPRTSANRLLQDWQREKIVTLKKNGRKTKTYLTVGLLDRFVNFLDYFMTTTASIHKKIDGDEESTEAN
jgi:DNA-binding IclR family transcriptional regulator